MLELYAGRKADARGHFTAQDITDCPEPHAIPSGRAGGGVPHAAAA